MKIFFSLPEFDGQLLRTMGYTYARGADIGECLTTAFRIKEGDFDSWYNEWILTANRIDEEGEKSLQCKNYVSAREAFLRASNYYRTAYFFLMGSPVDPRLIQSYDLHVNSFNKALPLISNSNELIEIPYQSGFIKGILYKCREDSKPTPTIITGPGYDGTHQESYLATAVNALKRGYHVFCFDGPGQGDLLIKQNIYMTADWDQVISTVLDNLFKNPLIDQQAITLIGTSWGGMLAPLAAAKEHRINALILNPGQFDALEKIKKMVPQINEYIATDNHIVLNNILSQVLSDKMMNNKFRAKMWIHGKDSAFELVKEWSHYNLETLAKAITCRTLVLDSENEPLSPGQAKQLFDCLSCPKDYILMTLAEGAGEHCAAGASAVLNQRIFDWLSLPVPVFS